MNVADVMTPREDVVTVEIPGTRDDVLEYLQDRAFSSVPVIKESDEGEIYRGIVSRDALIEAPDEDQLAILAAEVPTTTSETTLEAVAELMQSRDARRIPVVDGDTLEGIITVTDIVHAIASGDLDGETELSGLARQDVNTTYEDAPLPVAERELYYAKVPYAVVLDEDGDIAGMVTEVDILEEARVVEGEADTGESIADDDDDWKWESIKAVGNSYMPTRNVEIPAEPVGKFMTDDLLTVTDSRTAQDAAQLMIDNDIEQLPMVSGDELVGIVRDMDLLEAV